jgi:hypothetical protein
MRWTTTCATLLVLACASGDPDQTPADTLTQRQRDSVVGASGLPGARGVQGALDAADSAAARNERLQQAEDP